MTTGQYAYGRNREPKKLKHVMLPEDLAHRVNMFRGEMIIEDIDLTKAAAVRRLLEIGLHQEAGANIPSRREWARGHAQRKTY